MARSSWYYESKGESGVNLALMRSIDFSNVLMQGMLSLLLFAGALHIDLSQLRRYRWQVAALALVGTWRRLWSSA